MYQDGEGPGCLADTTSRPELAGQPQQVIIDGTNLAP
jgi:hypothetical protein